MRCVVCDDNGTTNKTVKLSMFERDCGREPVKPHSERKSMLSFLRFPMSFGIGPCMFGFDESVLCAIICESDVLVSLFLLKSTTNSCKRLVRFTYDGGIAPVKKFWSRYRTQREGRFAKPGGKSPVRKLLRKSLLRCHLLSEFLVVSS